MMQVLMWNYLVALLLSYFIFKPDFTAIGSNAPWVIYILLSVLLPVIFLFLIASIRHTGIVKTDAAQRLSLIIPILAAYFIFQEKFNLFKIIGISICFPAIWLILKKPDANQSKKWIFPAAVLLGFGVIDTLFKKIASYSEIPYTTSIFIIFAGALIVAKILVANEMYTCKTKIQAKNALFGFVVGIFNFGNIIFYLTAHKIFATNPSTVFAIINIGVIILGSIVGTLVFKEKLSILNYAGILLAVAAILFITLSQVY